MLSDPQLTQLKQGGSWRAWLKEGGNLSDKHYFIKLT